MIGYFRFYEDALESAKSWAKRENKTIFVLRCQDGSFDAATTPHIENTFVTDKIEGVNGAKALEDEGDDDDV